MEHLRIRNWRKWQSYRSDRGQPPWIKVHRCIMRDPEWVSLTDAERGQLVAMWLLAADHDGVIPASPTVIQKLCYMDTPPNINKFMELYFIDVNKASTGRQHDETETETETDKRIKIKTKYSDLFLEFWTSYPTKVGKKKASVAWKKIIDPESNLHTILTAIKNQTKEREQKLARGVFIPEWKHPATWLNGECWEDEVEIDPSQELVTF
jgi:hypothetical protein